MRALVAIVFVAMACAPSPSATANPGAATGSVRTFVRASPLVPSGPVTVRATKVPQEFRYVEGAELEVGRIWLADLSTGNVIDVIATHADQHLEVPFSASADGRRLAIETLGPGGHAAVYVVDVETGAATIVYEDAQRQRGLVPVISPDGARLAFEADDGVHLVDTTSRGTLRTVEHDDPRAQDKRWYPVSWSADSRWLAIDRQSEAADELAIVDAGREKRILGVGTMAAWRTKAPELLVMDTITPFGGHSVSYTYDLTTNRGTPLEQSGNQRRASLSWHPSGDRFLYLAAPNPVAFGDLYVRAPNEQVAARVSAPRPVIDGWWSRDGSKVYGLLIRQDALRDAIGDANYEIAELPSGRIVATVCRGDPRAVCP